MAGIAANLTGLRNGRPFESPVGLNREVYFASSSDLQLLELFAIIQIVARFVAGLFRALEPAKIASQIGRRRTPFFWVRGRSVMNLTWKKFISKSWFFAFFALAALAWIGEDGGNSAYRRR